ncbi:MAG: hypothetical protein WA821_02670, partial [Anaerolineales bacterium]
VFSGKARAQIVDKDFAEGDTAVDAVTLPPGTGGSIPPVSAFTLPAAFTPLKALADRRPHIALAALGGVGVIILCNFFAGMLSVTGLSVYRYGWAFEIFLVAGFLAGIGWSLRNPWLLTPAVILAGNAFILAYCAITGRWGDWLFLWMLEPFIVAAAVILPRALRKGGDPVHIALANMSFAALTVLLACLTCSLSLVALVIRTLLFP